MPSDNPIATNLRRLMAEHGLTIRELARRSNVDHRTVQSILRNGNKPHARSLNKLAKGLGVPADELFLNPSLLVLRCFDRVTNPFVDEVTAERPDLFDGWSEAEFDELYSRVGTGGNLTRDGVVATAEKMNTKREVHRKVSVVLESSLADAMRGMVEVLYREVEGQAS